MDKLYDWIGGTFGQAQTENYYASQARTLLSYVSSFTKDLPSQPTYTQYLPNLRFNYTEYFSSPWMPSTEHFHRLWTPFKEYVESLWSSSTEYFQTQRIPSTKHMMSEPVVICGVIGLVVAFAVVPVIRLIGFRVGGVAAKSLAALWQSTMGGIVRPLFSVLQRIGVLGLTYPWLATIAIAVAVSAYAIMT